MRSILKMRTWLFAFAVLLLAVTFTGLLPACGDDEEKGPPTLKIGILLDFTGDLAEFGPAMENGAKLAAKHINDAGGVNGQPIELVRADSATSTQVGVSEATRLVNVEKVSAIVGSLASGVTLEVASAVTIPNEIPQISPASTSPALTTLEDEDFLFRTTISDAAQGVVLGKLAKELGYDTVSTMYVNNAYGQGLSAQFKKTFEELGGTVPEEVSHEQEQTTYVSELRKAAEGDPDAMVAISYPVSASVYLKEAIEQDIITKFLFTDGTKSLDIIEAVGAEPLEGTYGTAPGSITTPGTSIFVSEYEEEYGAKPPLPYIGETYDAVIVLALAAEKAGSNDPKAIRDALRDVSAPPGDQFNAGADGVKQALEAVKAGKDIDFEGAAGSQNFDEAGDVTKGLIEVFKIINGAIVTQRTEEVDLTKP